MQETTNIGLKTYEASDPTDWLADFNYNMNKIDESVGSQNASIATVTSTANQANSTATLANTTANSALTTANSKASIDDLASSDSTTYSSEKIDELISEIQPESEIDDSVTSTTKTWSSSKINSSLSAKNLSSVLNVITLMENTTYDIPRLANLNELVFTLVDNNRNVVSNITITKEDFVNVGYHVELREFVNNNMYTSNISFVEGTTIRIVNSSYLVTTSNYHIFVYGR